MQIMLYRRRAGRPVFPLLGRLPFFKAKWPLSRMPSGIFYLLYWGEIGIELVKLDIINNKIKLNY